MMFRFSRLVLMSALLFSCSPFQAFAQEAGFRLRWAVAHDPSNTVLQQETEKFAQALAKDSGGRIRVEIVQLPEDLEEPFDFARDQLLKGDVEMSQISVHNLRGMAPSLGVLALPELFRSHEHVEQVLDGAVGEQLRKDVLSGSQGKVRSLAFTYSGGFRHLMTRMPYTDPAKAKGAKARVSYIPEEIRVLEDLGANLVKCEHCWKKGPLSEMLATGKLEFQTGHTNRFANILSRMSAEQRKKFVITETNHSVFLTSILVGEKFFQSLPKDLQKVLLKNTALLAAKEREISVLQAEQNKEFLVQQGVKFQAPSPELRQKIKATAQAMRADQKSPIAELARRIESLGEKKSLQAGR